MKNCVDGRSFFEAIEIIRTSQYSEYLITNSTILELNSMEAIFWELKSINDLLDEYYWGIFYPIYKFYLQCRYIYKITRRAESNYSN